MDKNNVQKVFGDDYSSVYDSFYGNHDYDADINAIKTFIAVYGKDNSDSILDFGCGSGIHANKLSKTYNVMGVDISLGMLKQASEKYPHLNLKHGDVKNFTASCLFDVVTMNSAVLCYQLSNEDVIKTMINVRKHLTTQGLFIFDVWYGPAVLSIGPTVRMNKSVLNGNE